MQDVEEVSEVLGSRARRPLLEDEGLLEDEVGRMGKVHPSGLEVPKRLDTR